MSSTGSVGKPFGPGSVYSNFEPLGKFPTIFRTGEHYIFIPNKFEPLEKTLFWKHAVVLVT